MRKTWKLLNFERSIAKCNGLSLPVRKLEKRCVMLLFLMAGKDLTPGVK